MTVLFEPASAIAAGICLTARTIADGRTARHPRPCGWCDFPVEELRGMVDGFEAWAERDRQGVPRRHEAIVFQSLPGREQAALVLEAQGFPEPVAEPAVEPTEDAGDDGGPVWK